MVYLTRGRDEILDFVPKNKFHSTIDLTGLTIQFNLKASLTEATNVFEKKNTAAGGGDTQIKIVRRSFRVFIDKTDTASLDNDKYFYEYIVDGEKHESGYIRFKPMGRL